MKRVARGFSWFVLAALLGLLIFRFVSRESAREQILPLANNSASVQQTAERSSKAVASHEAAPKRFHPAPLLGKADSPPSEDAQHPSIVRRRAVHLDVESLAQFGAGDRLRFNFFEDAEVEVTVEEVERRDESDFSLIGSVAGEELSTFILTVFDDAAVANIRSEKGYFQIRYSGSGIHEVREIDESKFPACGNADKHGGSSEIVSASSRKVADIHMDTGEWVDVMVVYTARARKRSGGLTGISALIRMSIDETNLAYAASKVNCRVRLVHTAEVVYSDSGSFDRDLDRLTDPADGYLDEVHELRDRYGADLVSLLATGDIETAGLAWQLTSLWDGDSHAFSVVDPETASSHYVLAHELGHNMGCEHDYYNASGGLYSYSHGWRFRGASGRTFRTIMAYSPGVRVRRFSSPSVFYDGAATGHYQADNARTLNRAAYTVANWRTTVAPAITTQPVSQSAMAGSSVVFKVVAEPLGLKYQWFLNGKAIPGATSSRLKLTNVQVADAGNYKVRVTNPAGHMTSNVAALTVCTIDVTPALASFGFEGGTGALAITVSGGCDFNWSIHNTNTWVTAWNSNGNSSALVNFSVAPNPGSTARAAFLMVAGKPVTITQAGGFTPASIQQMRFVFRPASGSGVLAGGENSAFVTSLTGNTFQRGSESGTYGFGRFSQTTGRITWTIDNSFSAITDLTFTSPTSGTYTAATVFGEPGNQSGAFVMASAAPDYNGDGFADLLWQHTNGPVRLWSMDGTNLVRGARFETPARGWRLAGQADLNGDGWVDLIWQHEDGRLAAWLMEGTQRLVGRTLKKPASGWQMVGVADFNDDGRADFLFRDKNGRCAIWWMSGENFAGSHLIRNGKAAGSSWLVAGIADFNGDRQPDLLLQHLDGRMIVWHLIGGEFVSATSLRASSARWRVGALHDFDDDGATDLLLQHIDGRLNVWFMAGPAYLSNSFITGNKAPDPAWRVVAPK